MDLLILNPFRLCSSNSSSSPPLKFLGGYFMILLILCIISLSYYAVVIITWAPRLLLHAAANGFNFFLSFLILFLFHLLLVLLTWSYFMTVFRDPGTVPNIPIPPSSDDDDDDVQQDDNNNNNFINNSLQDPPPIPSSSSSSSSPSQPHIHTTPPPIRYCNHCQNLKPPRSHHCSLCQRCVLKMDHHCIWVVNCVGARNYKFFLLFVLYTFMETTLDTLALIPSFVHFFQQVDNPSSTSPANLALTFLAFVLNLAFSLSLLCFVVIHVSLLLSNTTSVEVHEKKKGVPWKYDLGKKRNIEQVFGTRKALWLLPMFSKEDLERVPALQGLDFPTRSDVEV